MWEPRLFLWLCYIWWQSLECELGYFANDLDKVLKKAHIKFFLAFEKKKKFPDSTDLCYTNDIYKLQKKKKIMCMLPQNVIAQNC